MASIPIARECVPSSGLAWQAVDLLERVGSAALIVALGPVLAGGAVALSLLSGRTPLIAHKRVGWRGTTLWMLKLRTMWNGEARPSRRGSRWVEYIEDEAGPLRKQPDDPRVTNSFARFCRRHSIDELPQLWHVIRGEMALVGPRPATAGEVRDYYGADAGEILRLKPGIAGLWQISGRNRLSYGDRRRLDLEYARSRSLRMYARILLRAVVEVWSGANSW